MWKDLFKELRITIGGVAGIVLITFILISVFYARDVYRFVSISIPLVTLFLAFIIFVRTKALERVLFNINIDGVINNTFNFLSFSSVTVSEFRITNCDTTGISLLPADQEKPDDCYSSKLMIEGSAYNDSYIEKVIIESFLIKVDNHVFSTDNHGMKKEKKHLAKLTRCFNYNDVLSDKGRYSISVPLLFKINKKIHGKPNRIDEMKICKIMLTLSYITATKVQTTCKYNCKLSAKNTSGSVGNPSWLIKNKINILKVPEYESSLL